LAIAVPELDVCLSLGLKLLTLKMLRLKLPILGLQILPGAKAG
jgi:hypothetical protein